jgi:hypothetical protein
MTDITPDDRVTATTRALQDLAQQTGQQLRHSAAAIALYAEHLRAQLAAAALAGEPGIDDAAKAALSAVKLFAVAEGQRDAKAFDARLVAAIGVALNIAGAAL